MKVYGNSCVIDVMIDVIGEERVVDGVGGNHHLPKERVVGGNAGCDNELSMEGGSPRSSEEQKEGKRKEGRRTSGQEAFVFIGCCRNVWAQTALAL